MKQVFLVDGHSLIYRSFFAFIKNPLRDSRGRNTSAIFGFVNSLKKLVDRFHPEFLAVAFDTGRPTARHHEYKEYKSNRPETPDELRWQVPVIKEIVDSFGFDRVELEGQEADDVLGSLARQLEERGFSVVVVTSDKDLMQLVNDRVSVYDLYKDLVYDERMVRERFGVEPRRVADILALAGDAVDNVPGVPGIGEKRAQDIILKFGTVEEALEHEPRLRNFRDLALLSKSLTLIRTDLKVEVDPEEFKVRSASGDKLAEIFKELEFFSLVAEIQTTGKRTVESESLSDPSPLASARRLAFGTGGGEESFVADGGEKVYRLDAPSAASLLGDEKIEKVGFDLKSFFLKNREPVPPFFDLKIAAWLVDPNRKKYAFPDLLLHFLAVAAVDLTPAEMAAYGLSLHDRLASELEEKGLKGLFHELEMPLVPILAAMEKRGTKIDVPFFRNLTAELAVELRSIEKRIFDRVGSEFNLGSPKQLSKVLFETLALKPRKRTKTGYSTDVEVLSQLAEEHEVPRDMLRYRELSKLVSTYLEPLVHISDPVSQRVHTSFEQTGTSTGRLSSADPNLQNIPIRTDLGRKIREGFIAGDGCLLLSADYSQIELRILAHLADDNQLREAFLAGEDVHIRTACAVLGITKEEVTPESRRLAKVVNYGLVYGMGEWGLASGLGISQEKAQQFITEYMAHYSKVAAWREKVVEEAEAKGCVRTLFGRVRPIPELKSSNRGVYEQGRRYALNTPIQGTAADIVKKAMIATFNRLKTSNFKGGLCLQIHDELVLEIEEERIDEAKAIVKHEMEHAAELTVPLLVDIGVGKNWALAH